jgi:hypothetical protein
LSENGVPDDDMSDSLPPDGGPDPYDGWDLEGMLSGAHVWLPDGMRPVARTLSALRAAPTQAEVAGEASARAAFRQIMRTGGTGPGWPVRGADDGQTLILPAQGAGGGTHVVTRPRHSHRRPPRRGRWQPKALAGAAVGAAVVAVVGGVALAGGFSGAGGHPGQPGQSSSAVGATIPSGHSESNGLDGSASKQPTAHPSPSHSNEQQSGGGTDSAARAAGLCRQYLAFLAHHESQSDRAKESDTIDQLTDLAGSSHIFSYCVHLPQPWAMNGPGSDDGPGLSPPDDSQGGSGSGGPQDSQGNDQSSDGHNGNGSGPGNGAGNGRAGNNSGSGNQNQQ